jgi:hypothetical protein
MAQFVKTVKTLYIKAFTRHYEPLARPGYHHFADRVLKPRDEQKLWVSRTLM